MQLSGLATCSDGASTSVELWTKVPHFTSRASSKRTLASTSVWQHPNASSQEEQYIGTVISRRQLSLSLDTRRLLSTSSKPTEPIDYTSLDHSSLEVQNLIEHHARKPQTSASLQTLMKTGRGEFLHKMAKHNQGVGGYASVTVSPEDESEATPLVLLQVASFLRRELPIRLAHRIHDLSRVSYLQDMKSVQQVKDLYTTSFLEILSVDKHPPSREDSEAWEIQFAKILENIYERHSSVLVQMARGAFELRAAIRKGALLGVDDDGCDEGQKTSNDSELQVGRDAVEFELMESTHAFLDRFYISRIGIRVLIGQYLSLRQPPVENYVGIICSKTSPYEIVKRAIDDAAFMCTRKYGDAPEVIITGRLDMTFPYVPTHLHYIMLELLKNSMRATVEYHGIDADYPPIKVVIADGSDNEDVIIKVSDEGGGIPRSNMKRIWSYLFTTADPEIQEGMVAFNENVDHSIDSPLAGLGYGLPISRSYARYFGGDLSIMSMEGYGTDCFVYLTRLGNTREPLPI
jgi:pyruvate dehydrogenase kinase 2/3/4